ncbi:hypothetical protein [Pontibacter burrus]|uniref:Uncharacterized protein n=1 Tax=Pontibacter burrus TaxID=2704466 RepID=A0A6B3LTL5_9BACT|nr:hypothetical protein [Pontibacter burrus]NEM98345.1 hypothetical protein [Pontibacter burrus]
MSRPRSLAASGTFIHAKTKTPFPKDLAGYKRKSVYAFDKEKTNIGTVYWSADRKTKMSVYLYPYEVGTEDRLKQAYSTAYMEVAVTSKKGITATQKPISYIKDDYKINGLQANIKYVKEGTNSYLSVFECGKWLFKFRITSEVLDSAAIQELATTVIDTFAPTNLVKLDPLDIKPTLHLAPGATADSVITVSVLGSAFEKMQWVTDNVSPLERAAGFPGLYLELHVASLKAFAAQEQDKRMTNSARLPSTTAYLAELNKIISSGYLREFIMKEYDMLLIVPENITLDFEGFLQWRKLNPISIDLSSRFYVLSYK